MKTRARRAAKSGGRAPAKAAQVARPQCCSSVFETALVAGITEWFGRSCDDVFHLGWSTIGCWREVQSTLAVLDLRHLQGVITDTVLKSIVRRFPALRCLDLPDSLITDAGIRGLSSLKNLRELDISNCVNITVNKGIKFLPKNLEKLAVGCYGNGSDHLRSAMEFDAIVIAAARRCTRLRDLAMYSAKFLTDAAIVEVANKCVHLRRLDLIYSNITDRAIITLSEKCDLEDVNLNHSKVLTDASVVALAANCPRLKKIDIGGIKQLTNASVLALSRCASLESVDVSFNENITDSSIIPLVMRRGASLLCLNLGATYAGDASVRAIAENCGMMKYLHIWAGSWMRSARNITDSAILDLAPACSHLHNLTLQSGAITDAFVSGVRELVAYALMNKSA